MPRLQEVFAVLAWLLLVPGFSSLGFLLGLGGLLLRSGRGVATTFTLLYLAWRRYDGNRAEQGGRPWPWLLSAAPWGALRDYFPVRLVRTAPLPPDRNYLLCCFPHAIIPVGPFTALCTEALSARSLFPGLSVRWAMLDFYFRVPLQGELLMAGGGVSASARSMRHELGLPGGGRALMLYPGGAAEALTSSKDCYRVVLRPRKGFCKLALQEGAPLVPVFTFGEHLVYDQVRSPALRRLQEAILRLLGVPAVLPFGRADSLGLLPNRTPLNVVVGAPIPVARTPEPSAAQVEELHDRFHRALVELFERHKTDYHPGEDIQLIVE